jgi:hypothetical protein
MIEFKKTAAEMLEYYKIEVFGKMGIDIDGLQDKDTAYQKWATRSEGQVFDFYVKRSITCSRDLLSLT